MALRLRILRTSALGIYIALFLFINAHADPSSMESSASKGGLSPQDAAALSRFQYEQKQRKPQTESDDPSEAWNEWDETPELKRRRPARRTRGIQPGMDIHAIMAQMDKQQKIYFADVGDMIKSPEEGQAMVTRFTRMLAAGGVLADVFYLHDNKQMIVKCESVRDAFVSKDFFLKQPEVKKITLDGMPHTPIPKPKDDDDDDGDDDDDKGKQEL